jgi:hypothetical protein
MGNPFVCAECHQDVSLTAPVQPSGHAADCLRRGGRLNHLCIDWPGDGAPEPCYVVAQCRDSHSFWQAERRTGMSFEAQSALAEEDLNLHNVVVHSHVVV